MKISLLCLTVGIALISGACQQTSRTIYSNNSLTTIQTTQPTQTAILALKVDPANLSIRLERTGCNGSCPVYSVAVQPDGKVVFEGGRYTSTKGKAEDTLPKEKMAELADAINTTNYAYILHDEFTRESGNCPDFAKDDPSVTLMIESGDQKRTFRNDLGCLNRDEYAAYPAQLVELEKKVDRIIGTERWIGSADAK
jgi:hypothetical protein